MSSSVVLLVLQYLDALCCPVKLHDVFEVIYNNHWLHQHVKFLFL